MTPRLTLMNPVLPVSDMPRALAFYRDVLGFEVLWQYGEPTVRAGVGRDGFDLQLDLPPEGARGPVSVYFHVDDVESYHAACSERGGALVRELGDQPFGLRDFVVEDPDGNHLGFGQPLSDESPEA